MNKSKKLQFANPVKFLRYKKILILLLENFSLQNWIKLTQTERWTIKDNFWPTIFWRIFLKCCDLTRKKIENNCVKLTYFLVELSDFVIVQQLPRTDWGSWLSLKLSYGTALPENTNSLVKVAIDFHKRPICSTLTKCKL